MACAVTYETTPVVLTTSRPRARACAPLPATCAAAAVASAASVELTFKLKKQMMLDVATGMQYLHSQNPVIIHRDLKSLNVLIDENWVTKVRIVLRIALPCRLCLLLSVTQTFMLASAPRLGRGRGGDICFCIHGTRDIYLERLDFLLFSGSPRVVATYLSLQVSTVPPQVGGGSEMTARVLL